MHFGGMGGGMRAGGMGFAGSRVGFAGSRGGFAGQRAVRGSAFCACRVFRITADSSITASIALRSVGVPYAYAAYDSCWRRTWTPYGLRWVNVCGDYGYY